MMLVYQLGVLAVLVADAAYSGFRDVGDLPAPMLDRLRHYFLTYKDVPGSLRPRCELTHVYGREEAHEVIRRSQQDYAHHYGDLAAQLAALLGG